MSFKEISPKINIDAIPATHPLKRLIIIASKCLIKIFICLYKGIARHTVDGVNNIVINCAPLL